MSQPEFGTAIISAVKACASLADGLSENNAELKAAWFHFARQVRFVHEDLQPPDPISHFAASIRIESAKTTLNAELGLIASSNQILVNRFISTGLDAFKGILTGAINAAIPL